MDIIHFGIRLALVYITVLAGIGLFSAYMVEKIYKSNRK